MCKMAYKDGFLIGNGRADFKNIVDPTKFCAPSASINHDINRDILIHGKPVRGLGMLFIVCIYVYQITVVLSNVKKG